MGHDDTLGQRAATVKQELLLALRALNAAHFDGTRPEQDRADLEQAVGHARAASDLLHTLLKRLDFYAQLEAMERPSERSGDSRFLISIMRLGVDAGFTVEEVRRIVDAAKAKLSGG
jgi:hypothetical protein